MSRTENARYWQHPGLPGVDLLKARYITHTFTRHTHSTYTIGLVGAGVEEWRNRGSLQRAGPGWMPVVNPDTVHTGHAGVPEGWSYRVLYPAPGVVASVAAELGMAAGTPSFPPVLHDTESARLLLAAHRAAETQDALAASTLTRLLLAHMLRAHGRVAAHSSARMPGPAAGEVAARARDLLEARLGDPPSLEALAAEVGTRPFPLLRAFRARYGLPPHSYLIQRRVDRARVLLDAGHPVADVAVHAGFYDQAHLSRHFRRILGVPPASYRNGRKNVQERRLGRPLPSPV
jgi:AraC-like DNA-binding protein